jgi:hypothetical protein
MVRSGLASTRLRRNGPSASGDCPGRRAMPPSKSQPTMSIERRARDNVFLQSRIVAFGIDQKGDAVRFGDAPVRLAGLKNGRRKIGNGLPRGLRACCREGRGS